jgi:hypothetical protein
LTPIQSLFILVAMSVVKRSSGSKRILAGQEAPKKVRLRHPAPPAQKKTDAAKRPFDKAYHEALSATLEEWSSPEDDEAFRDL